MMMLVGDEGKKIFGLISLPVYHIILTFIDPVKKGNENIAGNGGNAGKQHFPHFSQCFLPI